MSDAHPIDAMWTPAARAELVRENLPFATCLSDAQWAVLTPLLPAPARTGRLWLWSQRAVLDGILYVLRTGCAWRHLPLDFPPWGTVHRWFLRWAEAGVFERLAHALTLADRERVGREAGPTGAILDAQAARSGGVGVEGVRGYDPAKRVVGRKRHALTGIAPDWWFLLTLRGSGGQNDAALQEIEACPSVALALDELEPVDLAFSLAATPWLHETSPDGRDVRL